MDYNCYHFGSSTVDRDIGVDWNKNIYGTESESMCAANELSNYHNVILCSIVMSTSSGLKKRMTLDLDRYISHVTSCVYIVVELYRVCLWHLSSFLQQLNPIYTKATTDIDNPLYDQKKQKQKEAEAAAAAAAAAQ